jgi:hypothetical protein
VLVDRAERGKRRRPLASLAQAFGPELHVPRGKTLESIGIRKHHARAHAAFLGESNRHGGTDGRRKIPCPFGREHGGYARARSFAKGHDIEPAGEGRQKSDIGQSRKATANSRIVVECGNAEVLAKRAKAVGDARLLGLGHGQKEFGDALVEPCSAYRVERGNHLHQGLGRSAGFRDHNETCGLEVETRQRKIERAGVEIVVEARARALLAAMLVVAGNAPAAELR